MTATNTLWNKRTPAQIFNTTFLAISWFTTTFTHGSLKGSKDKFTVIEACKK